MLCNASQSDLSSPLLVLSQEGPDYKALHSDLEKEVERLRTEGEEHARLLSQDAAKAKEAASAARAEAARARNEAEYERDRATRLQEQLRDAHRQLDALTQSNTKYQVRLRSRPNLAPLLGLHATTIYLPCCQAPLLCLSYKCALCSGTRVPPTMLCRSWSTSCSSASVP